MNMVASLFSNALYEGLAYGLVALGVYLTFRVLSFPDLTVDGSFPLGGAVAAILIVAGANPWLATLAALGAGIAAGLCTSLLNTQLRINALLAGILMMVALYSINLVIMGRANISLLREVTVFDQVSSWTGIDNSVAVSIIFMVVGIIVILVLLDWFLHTEIGLALRATGENQQMVRGLGANTDLTTILGVALSNGLVALSGALISQNQGFADAGMGIGMIVMGSGLRYHWRGCIPSAQRDRHSFGCHRRHLCLPPVPGSSAQTGLAAGGLQIGDGRAGGGGPGNSVRAKEAAPRMDSPGGKDVGVYW